MPEHTSFGSAAMETARHVADSAADPAVDVTACITIVGVVWAANDPGLAQIAVGGITSVAVGKRYLSRGGAQ